MNELKNRRGKDILILCADGLSGIKETIAATFPKIEYQRCIVHQVLWFCLQIAKGEPIWGMPVKQGEVLYLALEDHENRLQERIILLGEDAPESLHFSFSYPTLGNGLEEEIEKFLRAYLQTVLVVIDTLQMVRSNIFEYGYAADYKDMAGLKEITKNIKSPFCWCIICAKMKREMCSNVSQEPLAYRERQIPVSLW